MLDARQLGPKRYDDSASRDVQVACDRFADTLVHQLDAFWWGHSPTEKASKALRDYTVGVVEDVATSVQRAAVCMSMLRGARTAQDLSMQALQRASGRPYPSPTNDRYNERGIEIEIHAIAVVVATGSALDCLAAAICGVLGLPLDVRRVGFAQVLSLPITGSGATARPLQDRLARFPLDPDWQSIADRCLDGVRVALRDAGPAGWLDWLLDLRNTVVHREHRMTTISMQRERGGFRFSYLPPREPNLSNVEALSTAGDHLKGLHLDEDEQTTLSGCLDSMAAATLTIIVLLEQAWATRARVRPTFDFKVQWVTPIARDHVFEGYAPGSAGFDLDVAALANPRFVRRLSEADLMTQTRPDLAKRFE